MMSNSEARKRQVPAPAPSSLTDADREALFYRPRELNVSRDTEVLEGIIEGILAARLAEQREQDEELARGNTEIALATQREQIAAEIEGRRVHIHAVNESACEDGCGWLDFAARIVREGGAR